MKSARLLMVTLAATATLGGALLSPLVAQAAPIKIKCDTEANCHRTCTQQLPNGDTVYYDHGTTITVRDGTTGEEITFKCNEGNWERARTIGLPGFKGVQILGNIGVGGIGGIKGELQQVVCPVFDSGPCQPVGDPIQIGPPGQRTSAR